MGKLFTILSAVAITVGVAVPAGAATRSPGRPSDDGHPKAQHADNDRDRHVNHGDHDGDRDDRHFKDRDHDGDRDRRDFDERRHHDPYDHHHPYYRYYYGHYYDDRYYDDRYDYGRYGSGRYDYGRGYGYGDCGRRDTPAGVVVIRCLAFNPPQIHVAPGEPVVWSWADRGTPHTVTADDGSFDSGRRTDGEVRLAFDHPGEFAYHCRIHPRMTGSVIVG